MQVLIRYSIKKQLTISYLAKYIQVLLLIFWLVRITQLYWWVLKNQENLIRFYKMCYNYIYIYILRSIGNIRDPGIILYALQEIFNKIEDHLLEDHVTIKLSIFHFDQD